jgi:ATP-dependent DNA helicase RecG
MFKIFANSGVNISLLTGSMGEKERRLILDQVKNGKIHILIGTHALIQDDVVFKRLGLVSNR